MRSRARVRGRRSDRREGGAALVEFALIAGPLFLILFGVIEFGWSFYQLNDIRHGAREGIRLVAVDADPSVLGCVGCDTQGKRLAQAACDRMSDSDGVTITIDLIDLDADGLNVGDDATLVASKPLEQATRAFDPFIGGIVLDETITTRLEQSPGTGVDNTTWNCQ